MIQEFKDQDKISSFKIVIRKRKGRMGGKLQRAVDE